MRLQTERLILRPWEDRDLAPLARIMADAEVRRFFESTGTTEDAANAIARATRNLAERGMQMMAVELRADGAFVGTLGIQPLLDSIRSLLARAPEVEIGWQFDKRFWGQGLAPEGARAVLDFAWTRFALPEIVAITAAVNLPSQRVMQKLGMSRDPADDFEHPNVTRGHRLRPHVLYRITNPRT